VQLDDFNFLLPEELIAQYPCSVRSSCRLLYLHRDTGEITHHTFAELPKLLAAGDRLILNDTKVIPARFYVTKLTGGKVEVLVERILDSRRLLAQLRASKAVKVGARLLIGGEVVCAVASRSADLWELTLAENTDLKDWSEILRRCGKMPLPPYIRRPAEAADEDNYQTVYAEHDGSVAAPTAGLHFDEELFTALEKAGILRNFLTLHVGMGTFQPIRTAKIADHHMHAEYAEVSEGVCEAIKQTLAVGRRVVAVGTTTLRALESAALSGELKPYHGDTDIFIYGEHQFRSCNALITNFHLPKTTLLMLVCAFGGYEAVMRAYREAIQERYRFYSYGDAMLIA